MRGGELECAPADGAAGIVGGEDGDVVGGAGAERGADAKCGAVHLAVDDAVVLLGGGGGVGGAVADAALVDLAGGDGGGDLDDGGLDFADAGARDDGHRRPLTGRSKQHDEQQQSPPSPPEGGVTGAI